MGYYTFYYWFVYRLILASLAHFNWFMAVYTHCVYFSMWKSYDLLWFWMHLLLCSCFQSLRPENYLVVWCNLFWKRRTQYPHHTFRQLYNMLYSGGANVTKSERALQRMATIELKERRERRQRKISQGHRDESSSSSSEDEAVDEKPIVTQEEKASLLSKTVPTITVEEPSGSICGSNGTSSPPVRPPRTQRSVVLVEGNSVGNTAEPERDAIIEENEDSDDDAAWFTPQGFKQKLLQKFKRDTRQPDKNLTELLDGQDNVSMASSTWSKIRGFIPNPLKRSQQEVVDPNALDVLKPNYENTYDVKDPKKRAHREKHDRKMLTKKLRARIKEELRAAALIERRRKVIADTIELTLTLFRMTASFAILVGNIRKTFIPAQFKYLKPGQHAYDNYEMLLLYRVTTFLDISMFWLSVMWINCLQFSLFCRLGFIKFWMWAAFVGTVAFFVMVAPMSLAIEQMDLSWCRFAPNTTLAKYQPNW